MNKKMLINVEKKEIRIAIIEDSVLGDYYVERTDTERLVGNIYKGRVVAVVSGIQAAFVDIGLEKNGFLYISDITEPPNEITDELEIETQAKKPYQKIEKVVHKGQEITVQIVKEPLGTKGARLTSQIAIPGRFVVFMPNTKQCGISRRISEPKERERIREILKTIRVPEGAGVIVRTAASGCSKNDIISDIKYLLSLWADARTKAVKSPVPSLLLEEQDVISRVLRDIFSNEFSEIYIDSKDKHKIILKNFGKIIPNLRSKIRLYQEKIHLFEKFSVEDRIDRIYQRSVHLKSGGTIIIEPTEGLVAIDVNTGKFVGKKSLEETAYATNLEAAKEIARQIRLRDIGGIIVIDFVDMDIPEHRKAVFNELQDALKTDRARTKVLPMSELCVVEMTRQRTRKSLESASYQQCPSCKGRGLVKTYLTISIEILRDIKQSLHRHGKKSLEVKVHPDVSSYLLNEERNSVNAMENENGVKIYIRPIVGMGTEEYRIKQI
ncbi:hypothetical protein B9J78_01095 [bacterium Unc6]|nr:hypothetical protein [bacterium Unc6]